MRKPIVLRNIVADMTNFDWEIYLLNYPELVQKGIRTKNDACSHYKSIGFWEKRSCSISDKFDAEKYLKTYAYLGLKTPRDAYMHFMRIGGMIRKNEGMDRHTQAYKMPAMRSSVRRAFEKRVFNKDDKPIVAAAAEETVSTANNVIKRPVNTIIPSLFSIHGKKQRSIKKPKTGELILREPPSSYFGKMCIIGPPKFINKMQTTQ